MNGVVLNFIQRYEINDKRNAKLYTNLKPTDLIVGIGNPCAGQNNAVLVEIETSTNLNLSEKGNLGATLATGSEFIK